MQPIQIFGNRLKSKSVNSTAQERINLYLELDQADKNQVVAYGTPGLELFLTMGTHRLRGMMGVGADLYVVYDTSLYKINVLGISTVLGSLFTASESARVGIANNGTQLIIHDGSYGYTYTYSTGTFAAITDADFVAGNDVCFNDGFFITNQPNSGKFWISALYDGRTYDALNYATAESSPDNLVRVVADRGQLILFGELTTEFWSNAGALDFPYQRINGAQIEYGLAARWSVAKFNNSVIFLAQNILGNKQVVYINGFSPQVISTPDIEYIINQYDDIATASGFSYINNGHQFYQLNFSQGSWLYDANTQTWSQLKSFGLDRHRGELSTLYNGNTLIADYNNGNIYKFNEELVTDNGEKIVSELVTRHTFKNGDKLSITELWLDMETGNSDSTGQGSDPQIMLQISKDGGHTWGNERLVSMGKIGQYKTRARWLRLGQSRDWLFRFKISDPVKRTIIGAFIK